jgi:predicted RecA/RadA family phage recombinase
MATTVANKPTFFESDGKAVNVTLTAAVVKGSVIVVEGWLGIAGETGAIGEQIALICDDREYQFYVPAGLAVAKGAIVYIVVATVNGHYPDDTAYVAAAAAGAVAFFKATAAKDANNMVPGIMLAHNALAS